MLCWIEAFEDGHCEAFSGQRSARRRAWKDFEESRGISTGILAREGAGGEPVALWLTKGTYVPITGA
jgi:hypothetical protein